MKFVSSFFICVSIFACDGPPVCTQSAQCQLEPDPGFCRAYLKKYYFDKTEKKCKEFIWGGCDGIVPFDTMEECKLCECASSAD
jgi:hypothetical protein